MTTKPSEERVRIENAGGRVVKFGIPRINGILAVSRAFGDFEFKYLLYGSTAQFTNSSNLLPTNADLNTYNPHGPSW